MEWLRQYNAQVKSDLQSPLYFLACILQHDRSSFRLFCIAGAAFYTLISKT